MTVVGRRRAAAPAERSALMAARIGVVVFPGTNCEHDVVKALGLFGPARAEAELVWHGERSLAGYDAVVLPGGFAHGDYLRPGAIARFSPVMEAVAEYAADGGPVVGICNGFQVLTEAGLLPGALQKNRGLRFLCTTVGVRVCTTRTVLTGEVDGGRRAAAPHQPLRGQLHLRRRHPRPRCAPRTASSCATSTTPTARSTTSPGSATRPATWWASCRIPSGPATP